MRREWDGGRVETDGNKLKPQRQKAAEWQRQMEQQQMMGPGGEGSSPMANLNSEIASSPGGDVNPTSNKVARTSNGASIRETEDTELHRANEVGALKILPGEATFGNNSSKKYQETFFAAYP